MDAPICKTVICKKPLTYLEKQKCWRCLNCNPLPKVKEPEKEKDRSKYIDVPWTPEQEGRIRAIVRDELENWHIPKPTEDETDDVLTTAEGGFLDQREKNRVAPREPDNPINWRAQAKELGVELYDHERKCPRKKEDVLADIAKKTANA